MSLGFADTDDVDLNTHFIGFLGHMVGFIFVVLAVGDDDNSPAGLALGCSEGGDGGLNSLADGGALRLNECRCDGVQECLGGHIVAGDGQLDVTLAGKDDEADLIVDHLVNHLAEHLFGAVQTRRSYVLGEHGVGYIQGDDDLNTLPFDGFFLLSELRSRGCDDE